MMRFHDIVIRSDNYRNFVNSQNVKFSTLYQRYGFDFKKLALETIMAFLVFSGDSVQVHVSVENNQKPTT